MWRAGPDADNYPLSITRATSSNPVTIGPAPPLNMRDNVANQSVQTRESLMELTLDDISARWNLLQHSFYRRWTEGTLTRDELCEYVRQYAHVIRAVPVWLEQVRGGDTAQL